MNGEDEAWAVADKAISYFKHAGQDDFLALGVAVVDVGRHRTAQRFLWTKPPGGSALMCRFGIPALMSAKPRPSKKSKFKERTELDERYSGFYRA